MFGRIGHRVFRKRILIPLGIIAAAVGALLRPRRAEAHCDSTFGPVVNAARKALAAGDVSLILPYIKADTEEKLPAAEAELAAAFNRVMAVRGQNGDVRQLADRWFFETAVRLHRAGEGAPYTGLKDAPVEDPALVAADQALESGSISELKELLRAALDEGLERKYEAVRTARAHELRHPGVPAARERVEAELMFDIYAVGVRQAILGHGGHGEGQEAEASHHEGLVHTH